MTHSKKARNNNDAIPLKMLLGDDVGRRNYDALMREPHADPKLKKALTDELFLAIKKEKELKQEKRSAALKAANVRHDQPGGSRDKQAKIRKIWASGKYKYRDECAEKEHVALGMSFSTARKALRNF